jgi:hypothetical protein
MTFMRGKITLPIIILFQKSNENEQKKLKNILLMKQELKRN